MRTCQFMHRGLLRDAVSLVKAQQPVPPASAYDDWVNGKDGHWTGRFGIAGCKVRRAVIMRREGRTYREIGTAIGRSAGKVGELFAGLPDELL